MSKTSRFFLWVIVVGLAFIAGLRFYRAYEQRAEEEAATAAPTMTFNNVPVQRVSPQAEPQVYERWSGEPAVQEVYLQDAPLDAVQEKEQARQTVASVLSDYKDNPSLQAFYADLRAATGRDGRWQWCRRMDLRKAAFRVMKGYLLQPERPSFAS